jgi:hypothetical protein
MSLSSQDRPQNPSKFFLKVSGGTVHYYDKQAAQEVDVPVPFEFTVLDQLGTIKGWSDADQSGFWSNEVKSSGHDKITVRTRNGVKATGLWKDIKGDSSLAGAKFNASVYIAHKSGDGLVISNIAFQGASLNAWIEFIQHNKGVMKGKNKVVLAGFDDAKKGAVKYQTPRFEVKDITKEEVDIATDLDKELQVYLTQYFNYNPNHESGPQGTTASATPDVVIEDIDDEPINLDDIPF